MTVRMTSGFTVESHHNLSVSESVCLYDDTDGMAFGPTFEDRAEAEAFIRWFDKNARHIADSEGYLFLTGRITDLGSPSTAKTVADKWRAFLADHKPDECPYDDDSAGAGFMAARDDRDHELWTPNCACECHERAQG